MKQINKLTEYIYNLAKKKIKGKKIKYWKV
jgi:hypothetical protein